MDGSSIPLAQLAATACDRYFAAYPDDIERLGRSGRLWCDHDSRYLLAWALQDARSGDIDCVEQWCGWGRSSVHVPFRSIDSCATSGSRRRSCKMQNSAPSAREPRNGCGPLGTRWATVSGSTRRASVLMMASVMQTRAAYLVALLEADARGAQGVVEAALAAGLTVDAAYLDVLASAMYEVGVLWKRARITVAGEHLATAITQGVLATLAARLPRRTAQAERPVAVLGCGPEDFHGLGSRMVGDFLQAAGWRVFDLGAAAPASAFVNVAAERCAHVVCVSSSRAEHLDGVREVRRALNGLARPPLLAVGGNAYEGYPERASAVGADLHAADPRGLLLQLDAMSLPVLS
jgi:MerR family transcriptional regulator, light-induced transcriptional regulator